MEYNISTTVAFKNKHFKCIFASDFPTFNAASVPPRE